MGERGGSAAGCGPTPPNPLSDELDQACQHVIGTREGCALGMCNGTPTHGCGSCCACVQGCLQRVESDACQPLGTCLMVPECAGACRAPNLCSGLVLRPGDTS